MLGEWEPVLRAGAAGKERRRLGLREVEDDPKSVVPFVLGALLWHQKSKR